MIKTPFSNYYLYKQINLFVSQLEEFNNKLPKERRHQAKDYDFIRHFYKAFIDDRNYRALEVESTQYKKALQIAKSLFPMMTLWVLCMDGRVKSIHTNGASAGIGSSIRVPGGILKEFVRGSSGQLKLIPSSYFPNCLDRVFLQNDTVAEIFDSHIGCTARKGEESARGNLPSDAGLYSDVIHKIEMAKATKIYVQNKYKGKKHLEVIQTSFDPHSGFMYMGLETKTAISYAEKDSKDQFTDTILETLSEKGIIFSTLHFSKNLEVAKLFNKHFFIIDWKDNYIKSSTLFLEHVNQLKTTLLPMIEKRLIKIFPELKSQDKHTKMLLKERTMLLLTNAYNAYLHNTDQQNPHHHYRYREHEEEGIKVSEGAYPPYDISTFVLNDGNISTLPEDIELASGLVRSNRRDGRIKDRSKNYINNDEFSKAPVPIVIQEIIRDERLTQSDWKALAHIDWSDLATTPWTTMTDDVFDSYLEKKGKLTQSLANGIKKIRNKLIHLYDPHEITSAHLIDQYKTVLGIMCDHNRRTFAVIPFLKLGIN